MTTAMRSSVESIRDTVIGWRRRLHMNPELSFHEERTSQFVYDTLKEMDGLELSRPTATSVMARLRGPRKGPVLAMRADMDALPIDEKNQFDFASRSPGVMHACGHDGHTAMLLGAAKLLSAERQHLVGEIRFIFQHAEELYPGGAQQMVDAGVMDGVQTVIGAHLWLPLQVGKVGVVSGPAMASPDTFRLTIRGRGGHAAAPQQTVDSIAVAAQVVTNLQHIVARNVDPLERAVVSVTMFHAGTADNVIPAEAELAGTVRTFDAGLRAEIPRLMERIVRGVTSAHGATYELQYQPGYRALINDGQTAAWMRRVMAQELGSDAIADVAPTMGGEDFSAYLQRVPGAFFFIGARNEKAGIVHPHHHERFTVDEDALENGVRAFVAAALDYARSHAD